MRPLSLFVRALVIQFVAVAALLRYAVGRSRLTFVSDPTEKARQIDALRGRVLRRAMERLGATFIKLGQVMSSRPDLFAPALIAELRALQDRLPAFPGARSVIDAELGAAASRFRELDDAPVAAASVAQVHRGVLDDGTEVAVKVLRPDVRAKAEGDGRILLAFAGALETISGKARHARLREHVSHFIEGIVSQTDLRTEARNYERFRTNFKKVRKVKFPKVYADLSGERVMTMEFVRGEKVDALTKVPAGLGARLREAFLKMSFEDGFLHADLHPGNFVVAADGTVFIFDVGLVKEFSEEMLVLYVDFNRCLVMGDVDDLMAHLRKYHSYVDGTVDWVELERDVARFATHWRVQNQRDLEFGKLIDEIFGVARKHGVRPIPEMTLMMVGLVTAEGIGKILDPDVNSFQEVTNFLIPVLARRNMLSESLMRMAMPPATDAAG